MKKWTSQMSEKLCGYRNLTDKRLENEKFKVSVKCLFYLIWIRHLTYRSDVYWSDEVTPFQDLYQLSLVWLSLVQAKLNV